MFVHTRFRSIKINVLNKQTQPYTHTFMMYAHSIQQSVMYMIIDYGQLNFTLQLAFLEF